MRIIKKSAFFFNVLLQLFYSINCSIHLYYEIKDYKNEDGKDALGFSCDYFSSNCDPIFQICFESIMGKCDIHSQTIDMSHRTGHISFVGKEDFTVEYLKIMYLRVDIEDMDILYNDHIGTFYKELRNQRIPYNFTNSLIRKSGHYKVSIRAYIHASCTMNYYRFDCTKYCLSTNTSFCDSDGNIVCKTNYYGYKCSTYCIDNNNYRCDSNGTKICRVLCGNNEICNWSTSLSQFICVCKSGYYGSPCKRLIDSTTISSISNSSTSMEVTESLAVSNSTKTKSFDILRNIKTYNDIKHYNGTTSSNTNTSISVVTKNSNISYTNSSFVTRYIDDNIETNNTDNDSKLSESKLSSNLSIILIVQLCLWCLLFIFTISMVPVIRRWYKRKSSNNKVMKHYKDHHKDSTMSIIEENIVASSDIVEIDNEYETSTNK